MSLSPSNSAAPERDVNQPWEPRSVTDVLRGPHIKRFLNGPPVSLVEVEPLRFIPRMRLGDHDVFPDRSRRA